MHAAAAAGALRARAPAFVDPPGYARRRPETTLLYQWVEQHYPPFRSAENFQVEEISDPRDMRPLLCEFAILTAPVSFPYRP